MANAAHGTGARDAHYDVISLLYRTLQEGETLLPQSHRLPMDKLKQINLKGEQWQFEQVRFWTPIGLVDANAFDYIARNG